MTYSMGNVRIHIFLLHFGCIDFALLYFIELCILLLCFIIRAGIVNFIQASRTRG